MRGGEAGAGWGIMDMKRRNLLAGFVVALGCSQMVGYLTGAKTVSACGAGTCFAPMAEVFSRVETAAQGETFEPFRRGFQRTPRHPAVQIVFMALRGGCRPSCSCCVCGAVPTLSIPA